MHRKRWKQLIDTLKTLDLAEHEETENGLYISKPQWDLDYYIRKAAAIVKARSASVDVSFLGSEMQVKTKNKQR